MARPKGVGQGIHVALQIAVRRARVKGRPAVGRAAALGFGGFKVDHRGVDELFACMFETDGDAVTVHGLDLPQAPIGGGRITDELAGFKPNVICHMWNNLDNVLTGRRNGHGW